MTHLKRVVINDKTSSQAADSMFRLIGLLIKLGVKGSDDLDMRFWQWWCDTP